MNFSYSIKEKEKYFAMLKVDRINGKTFEETHGPAKPGEISASALNAAKAKEILGWEPKVALSEGLVATATWFKARARES